MGNIYICGGVSWNASRSGSFAARNRADRETLCIGFAGQWVVASSRSNWCHRRSIYRVRQSWKTDLPVAARVTIHRDDVLPSHPRNHAVQHSFVFRFIPVRGDERAHVDEYLRRRVNDKKSRTAWHRKLVHAPASSRRGCSLPTILNDSLRFLLNSTFIKLKSLERSVIREKKLIKCLNTLLEERFVAR